MKFIKCFLLGLLLCHLVVTLNYGQSGRFIMQGRGMASKQINEARSTMEIKSSISQEKNMGNSSLNLSPNPVQKMLKIIYVPRYEHAEISIRDAQGNPVLKTRFNNEIDVSVLPSGLYLITISDGVVIKTGKFIKH